ncbi:MAG: glutamate racemase [Bacteroidaceae bacterium]|nr:glutamate racemase [Bacteroidaceae bacterium]
MHPIGIFDSGYGGLTILRQIRQRMPQYDYLYLGDNARAPYGSHSFEIVYQYTLQAVDELFRRGCELVILACNTASAKALRTIQQTDLCRWGQDKRVLGIIHPTVEALGDLTTTNHIGILATQGTINSKSYDIEIKKLHPEMHVVGQACPMWVPLVENNEYDGPGADYFVNKYLQNILKADPCIDTLILACTHYPLLLKKIHEFMPPGVRVIPQGKYVAASLENYLQRHPEMEVRCSKGGCCEFLTTESAEKFNENAALFMNQPVRVEKIVLR